MIKKQKRIDEHYKTLNIISIVAFAIFGYLIIRERTIPEYYIGFIGSILGFYLAKRPFEV